MTPNRTIWTLTFGRGLFWCSHQWQVFLQTAFFHAGLPLTTVSAAGVSITPQINQDQPWSGNALPTLNTNSCPHIRFTTSWVPYWTNHPCNSVDNLAYMCTRKKDLFTIALTSVEIEYPRHSEVVKTGEECRRRCKLMGTARCRGFSVKQSGNGVLCKIPDEGTLYFTNSTGGTLYHSKILPGSLHFVQHVWFNSTKTF